MHPDAVEKTEKRTAQGKHFENPDGTFSGVFSTGPVHYQAVAGGAWRDKKQLFVAGTGSNEWVSNESDVAMRTFETGQGGNRRWWVEFVDTLSGMGIRFALQFQPTVTPGSNRLDFSDSLNRTWSYYHSRSGGKMLGPMVPSSEGAHLYTFDYELIGGAPPLTLRADGSIACGTVFKMPTPYLIGANHFSYPALAWSLGSGTLSFSYDDTGLPASAYPYQVDPSTTFNVASSGNDDTVYKYDGASYPPAGAVTRQTTRDLVEAGRYQFSGFYIINGLFRWDTSGIDDAVTVTGGTFRGHCIWKKDDDGRNVTADYYAWDGTATDFSQNAVTGAMDSDITSVTQDVENDLPLSSVSGISKTGDTSLRMHISGGAPSLNGLNQLQWASFDNATFTEPRLIVDYSLLAGSYIQLDADGVGKKKRTQTHTVSTETVHTGYDITVGETGNRARVLDANPASTDHGLLVRSVPEAREQRFYQVLDLQGQTTEALESLTPTNDFATGTAATTFTVTAGKTLFVEQLGIHDRSNAATAFWAIANLRVNTGGAATAASPIALSAILPYRSVNAAAASFGSFDEVWYPGGVYIPSGASYGISFISSAGTASRLRVDIFLVGFEF